MPNNKLAAIRYRIINRCLLDYKEGVTLEYLKQACERALDIKPIGKRTLEGDIHNMRYNDGLGYLAPIEFTMGRYKYSDEDYSIDRFPINTKDLQNLKFASTILSQYKHISYLEKFQGTVQKIIAAINVRRLQEEEPEFPFIDFETAPLTFGSEFIEPLIQAIREQKVIELYYQSFQSHSSYQHILHPYYLKEYRNRWYLIAYHNKFKGIRVFGLDRIKSLNTLPSIPFISKEFDIKKYYQHSVGVTKFDKTPTDIVISFTKPQAKYILTQPLHESQELVEENTDSKIFQFTLIPSYEFTSQILGWGPEAEVISPEWHREKIYKRLKATLARYN